MAEALVEGLHGAGCADSQKVFDASDHPDAPPWIVGRDAELVANLKREGSFEAFEAGIQPSLSATNATDDGEAADEREAHPAWRHERDIESGRRAVGRTSLRSAQRKAVGIEVQMLVEERKQVRACC